ncbi:MAG: hypothetical protein ACFHU9_01420 [Fluviicola sp.]
MELKDRVNDIVEDAQLFAEAKAEQMRLNTVDKTTSSVASILASGLIAGVVFLCLLLISALGIVALQRVTGDYLIAIAIVLGFYLILLAVILYFKKTLLINPIRNKLIGEYLKMYEKKYHE